MRSDRTGQLIPLSNLVTLHEIAGATSLNRFNRIRSIEISAGLADGYTMGEAVKWFQDTVREKLPAGVASLAFNGESGEYLKSGGQLYITFVFAIAIVFLVLAAQFESFIHPSHHHGDGAARAAGRGVRAQALRVEHQHLQPDRGGHARRLSRRRTACSSWSSRTSFAIAASTSRSAVVQAAVTRLRPILMTSLCTAFGAIPFLFATGAGL